MHDQTNVAYGYCQCGCERKTRIATANHKRSGHVRGQPVRFVRGHWARLPRHVGPDWVEEDRGYSTPCWIWQRCCYPQGYGAYQPGGIGAWGDQRMAAHRAVFITLRGPVPAGLQLDHLCRNRACVNPGHLEPVTRAENIRRAPTTKLTMDSAREIRRRWAADESMRSLGRAFGISKNRVGDIVYDRSWRE